MLTTEEALDRPVKKELRTDMRDEDAVSRMRSLFFKYHASFRRNGVYWLTAENLKLSVQHFISAILPEALNVIVQSDLTFGYKKLKSYFKAFMSH